MKLTEITGKSRYIEILICLGSKRKRKIYMLEMAKELKITYAYCCQAITQLEKIGFLTTELKGRRRIITLTERGEILAKECLKLKGIMEWGK